MSDDTTRPPPRTAIGGESAGVGTDRAPVGGDRPPSQPSLARPPSDRYAPASAPAPDADADGRPGVARRAAPFVVVAVGALVVFALGLIDVSAGLVAVGLAIGWAIGIAVRLGRPARPLRAGPRSSRDAPVDLGKNRRSAVAAVLGAAAIVVGFGLVWVWSRTEGGVLDPLAYLDDRYGLLLAVAVPVVAAVAAAARAR